MDSWCVKEKMKKNVPGCQWDATKKNGQTLPNSTGASCRIEKMKIVKVGAGEDIHKPIGRTLKPRGG